jgi:hypothetical protein
MPARAGGAAPGGRLSKPEARWRALGSWRRIKAHTKKHYERTGEEITLGEVERSGEPRR